jgi:alginate O-acetyltransferase complex protein AlgI
MLEKCGFKKWLDKAPAVLSRFYTLFLVNLGWVIFAYDDLGQLTEELKKLFGFGGLPLVNSTTWFYLLSYGILFVLCILGSTNLPARAGKWLLGILSGQTEEITAEPKKEAALSLGEIAALVITVIFLLLVMTLAVAGLASDAFNPFLYFRF